jgi:hypothetical protein
VTAEWLGAVLDTAVRAVDVVPIGTGQTGATYRLTATYADDEAGLPATFAVKLSSQDETVRATVDDALVDAYHDELLGYGVTGYDRETCWRDYRIGVLQAPLLTVLGCAFASTTERGDDMMMVMLARGCQALRELGSLDVVRAL